MDIIGNIGSLVNLNVSVLAIQIINLVVLMLILNAVLYKPILNVMAQRDEIMKKNLAEADEIKGQSEQKNLEAGKNILQAKEKSRLLLNDTLHEIEVLREEKIRELVAGNKRLMASKQKEIDSLKTDIETALRRKQNDYVNLIMEKML